MCVDYVREPYSKLENRSPEQWNDLLKSTFDDGNMQISVLASKEESTVVKGEAILVE